MGVLSAPRTTVVGDGGTSPYGAEAAEPARASAGTRWGRFEILAQLGEGGMGRVYLAQDRELGRRVALKVLIQRLPRDAEVRRERLIREARALAQLDHVNVVKVLGFTRTRTCCSSAWS